MEVFSAGLICSRPEHVDDDGEGVESLPEKYPQSEDEEGTLTLRGETLEDSMV